MNCCPEKTKPPSTKRESQFFLHHYQKNTATVWIAKLVGQSIPIACVTGAFCDLSAWNETRCLLDVALQCKQNQPHGFHKAFHPYFLIPSMLRCGGSIEFLRLVPPPKSSRSICMYFEWFLTKTWPLEHFANHWKNNTWSFGHGFNDSGTDYEMSSLTTKVVDKKILSL